MMLHRLSLGAALAAGGAGTVLHAPPIVFLATAWLAGAGIAPLMGVHGEGIRLGFGAVVGAVATFLYSLLLWP